MEGRSVRAVEADSGKLLCLESGGTLEIWDRSSAKKPLSSGTVEGQGRLIGTPAGCMRLVEGKASLHDGSGHQRMLAENVQAASTDGGGILLATESKLLSFDSAGALLGEVDAQSSISAVARFGESYVVGFKDGTLDVWSNAGRSGRGTFSFEGTPSSSVRRIVPGPMGTLIAGYQDGTVGIWKLSNGKSLGLMRVTGPVGHLSTAGDTLLAASELGDLLRLDLSVFRMEPCELLEQVWRQVPVVWDEGMPVERLPPDDHECSFELGTEGG